jgi:hypothetical protein
MLPIADVGRLPIMERAAILPMLFIGFAVAVDDARAA